MGVGGARRALSRLGGDRAVIALYHRVLPAARARAGAVEPGMFVTPETFAAHLDWLAAETHVMPLHELVERRRSGRPLPARACAITFDDGWRDNLLHAAPALEARGLPATLFVVTARVGTPGAFWPDEVSRRMAALPRPAATALATRLGAPAARDPVDTLIRFLKDLDPTGREHALEELRNETPEPAAADRELLDWSEVEALAARGIDVESHGATHALLPQHDDDALARELAGSLAVLRARGLARHALLAYPSGAHDARTVAAARAAGYAAAVTTVPAWVGPTSDLHALPRIGVHEDVSRVPAELAYRLLRPAA